MHKKTYRLSAFMDHSPTSFNCFFRLSDGSLLMLGVGFIYKYKPEGILEYTWGDINSGNNISIVQTGIHSYAIGTTNGITFVDENGRLS